MKYQFIVKLLGNVKCMVFFLNLEYSVWCDLTQSVDHCSENVAALMG